MIPAILIEIEAGDWPPEPALRQIAAGAVESAIEVAALTVPARAELSLLFTDDAHMRAINRQWRGIDKPTNVLSFGGEADAAGATGPVLLGDIVLAHGTAAREAALEGKPFEHHLSHLIVHGLLHVFGYDHDDEVQAEAMEAEERRILERLGIADPYAGSG